MDLPSDRASDVAFEPVPPAVLMSLADLERSERHREINERRAALENPEMLRRLRSL